MRLGAGLPSQGWKGKQANCENEYAKREKSFTTEEVPHASRNDRSAADIRGKVRKKQD